MSKITAEEIEKASRVYANITHNKPLDEEERYYKDYQKYDGFIAGANWQKEQTKEHTKQNIEALRSELKDKIEIITIDSDGNDTCDIDYNSIDQTINQFLENIK